MSLIYLHPEVRGLSIPKALLEGQNELEVLYFFILSSHMKRKSIGLIAYELEWPKKQTARVRKAGIGAGWFLPRERKFEKPNEVKAILFVFARDTKLTPEEKAAYADDKVAHMGPYGKIHR